MPSSRRVQHLLAVAHAQFVDRGFDAVSIDLIARESAVSKETIYRHYPDKQALFRAALDVAGEAFTARTAALHRGDVSPEEELVALARTILDSAAEEGLLSAQWVAIGVARIMPDFARGLQEAQWQRLEPVRGVLESLARMRGLSGPVPLELAVDFGSLAVEGTALLMGFPAPSLKERDRIAERVARLFREGIGAVRRSVVLEGAPVPMSELVRPAPPQAHIRSLLDVASQHFMEQGFQGASLDVIGAEARVGRGTLYRHFKGKAGLFSAAMCDLAWSLTPADVPSLTPGNMDREELTAFLDAALAALASSRSMALHRAVITQSRRDPVLARTVFAIVQDPWLRPLIAWLGSIGVEEDPAWYSHQLLVLALRGNRLFAEGQPLTSTRRQHHAARAAAIFLQGFVAIM